MQATPAHEPAPTMHAKLLANGLAQAQALMLGKTADEARAEKAPTASRDARPRPCWRATARFPGNRPSTTLLLEQLTPRCARRADRAVRAPRVHQRRAVGHQQLRPVGRRARQGAVQRPAAAPGQSGDTDGLDGSTAGLLRRCARTARVNVVFDFGGVLFRWQPQEFMRGCCRRSRRGRRLRAWWSQFFGRSAATGASSTAASVDPRRWLDASRWRTGMATRRGHRGGDRRGAGRAAAAWPRACADRAPARRRATACSSCRTCRSPMPPTSRRSMRCFAWFEHGPVLGRLGLAKPERGDVRSPAAHASARRPRAVAVHRRPRGNVDAARRWAGTAALPRAPAQAAPTPSQRDCA